jgi:hypothetical protein
MRPGAQRARPVRAGASAVRPTERFVEVDLPSPCRAAHWTGPLAIKARATPNVYTIHDLIPLEFPHLVIDVAGRQV